MNLYITADRIGRGTGGGSVTLHEYQAMCGLGTTVLIDGNTIPKYDNPFLIDRYVESILDNVLRTHTFERAHIYAGTFTNTVRKLKKHSIHVTYTVAAHDRHESITEFGNLCIKYPYVHISDDEIFKEYTGGYHEADQLICPSQYSADLMRKYGCVNIKLIPHGTDTPDNITDLPDRFTIGYLGQGGPDKGLIYLIKAWQYLRYTDSTLVCAGNCLYSLTPYSKEESIELLGYVKSPSDLFNRCTIYIQPSVTEAFGIEILEAMAHNRTVITSKGAGAAYLIEDNINGLKFEPRDYKTLADKIDWCKNHPAELQVIANNGLLTSHEYSWSKIEAKYQELWRNTLSSHKQTKGKHYIITDADTEKLLAIFCEKKGSKILEVGAHDEPIANILSDNGHTVIGVDLRAYNPNQDIPGNDIPECNYTYTRADFCNLPVEFIKEHQGTFDAVISVSAMEHFGLETYSEGGVHTFYDTIAMHTIWKMLKPDGSVYLTVPYGSRYVENAPHWRIYNDETIKTRLTQGFTIEKTMYFVADDIIIDNQPRYRGNSLSHDEASSHRDPTPNISVLIKLRRLTNITLAPDGR